MSKEKGCLDSELAVPIDNHTTKGEIVELYDYDQVDSTNYSLLITSE